MKECFFFLPGDSQAWACEQTPSSGSTQETVFHSCTGKPGHMQRKVNLSLSVSCHSTTIPQSSQSVAQSHIWFTNQDTESKNIKSLKFTYWLAKVCCTHWWAVLAGPEARGSLTCGGRSRSRWALGSHWGGGPAQGCPSQPWWLKSTSSHKQTSLKKKHCNKLLKKQESVWIPVLI